MTVIVINLLGGFRVTSDGAVVTRFRGDKVRALLAYLAVESERPHPRSTLAALFWPELPDDQALNNLSQAITRLRAALGSSGMRLLALTRSTVQWRSGAEVDVHALTRLGGGSDAAALEHAAARYTGELLAGFTLEGCEAFDEWLLLARERLHQQVLELLTRLADHYAAAGLHEQAAAAARRQVALDPWRESAYQQLIRALAAVGDRAGALAAYERCRQVLLADLGVEPDAATSTLAEQLDSPSEGAAHHGASLPPLPTPLTTLVGRETELAVLSARLSGPVRLVTVVGPGGAGKTRLALAAAAMLRDTFPDGVCWTPLAGIGADGDEAVSEARIASALLGAIGHRPGGQRPPLAELLDVLAQRKLLLVLDNCEHLPVIGALVTQLLERAPGLRVLATSREPLGAAGDHPLVLGGLPVPPPGDEGVSQYASVQLFLERARRHAHALGADDESLAGVTRLCRLLEGMPLGIELAAHWVGDYTPDEIVAALQADIAFLETRDRDIPDRHRSLRAVFDHSWKLLPASEQRVLARVSVFAGGFDHAAALMVAEARPQTLARLVEKSLLRRTGGRRYSMHELLRQFAAEHCAAEPGEHAALQTRHSAFYLAFVAARERRLLREEPREAAAEIDGEIDNLRRAWAWAVLHNHTAALDACAAGLRQFYINTGQLPEVVKMLEAACSHVRQAHSGDEARRAGRLLALYAATLVRHARYQEAGAAAKRALELSPPGSEGQIIAHMALGQLCFSSGRNVEAWEATQHALDLASAYLRTHPQAEFIRYLEWHIHLWLRSVAICLSEYDQARRHAEEAVRLCRVQGQRLGEAICLNNLADVEREVYNLTTAREHYERAQLLTPGESFRLAGSIARFELGDVLRLQGDYTRALELTTEALAVFQEIGETPHTYLVFAALARLCMSIGDHPAADIWFGRCEPLKDTVAPPYLQIAALLASSTYLLWRGNPVQALADAEKCRRVAYARSHRYNQAHAALLVGHARAMLGHTDTSTAYAEALELYAVLGNSGLAAEARAGLAAHALDCGELTQANAHVEALLDTITSAEHIGLDEPFFVYLTCYRILAIQGDPRALDVLRSAYAELMRRAEALEPPRRVSFLAHVPSHRAITEAVQGQVAIGVQLRELQAIAS